MKLLKLAVAVGLFIAVGFLIATRLKQTPHQLAQIKKVADLPISEIEKEVITPPPLRTQQEAPKAVLTHSGVITWTNVQREGNGLKPLAENPNLNVAAELKVQDMFAKQYFAHEGPDGKGAGDWVKIAGYEFIAVGENLALGNFGDDQALVQAWMASPGHRANILNGKFTEIGVAVSKGKFEGKTTWLAVQVFGRPISACPQPSGGLKAQIDLNESQLNEMTRTLETKRREIETTDQSNPSEYNRKAEEYNALVNQYNTSLQQTKQLIEQYNVQVQALNQCVGT